MNYRIDINGLRAYAVLGVVLYHFGLLGMTGGFAGVDVFFVISGYLMTGLIFTKMDQGRFSVIDFYLDRARRIIPALFVLCAALLAFGWFYLIPSDFARLGKHAASSLSFISNFIYMDEEGYFDAPSRDKWLLHTWSLSVEWQFYILYPLVMAGLAFISKRLAKAGIIAILAASLAASILITPHKSTLAFYLLPARAWEMAAGGLAFLYAGRGWLQKLHGSRAIEYAGLCAIILSCFIFTPHTPWPGYAVILPVLGTLYVIFAARQQSVLLANPFCQAVGKWSYSIYLWHWPLVVALGYLSWHSAAEKILAMMAAIALGAASYFIAEQPAQKIFKKKSRRLNALALFGVTVLLILLCRIVIKEQGFPERVSADVARLDAAADDRWHGLDKMPPCGFDRKTQILSPCFLPGKSPRQLVVIGDSHAGMVMSAVQAATPRNAAYFSHACAPIFDAELKSKSAGNHCKAFNDQVLNIVNTFAGDVPVLIAGRFAAHVHGTNEGIDSRPGGLIYLDRPQPKTAAEADALYIERFSASLCRFAEHHPVYVLMPVPEMGIDVPKTMARRAFLTEKIEDVSIPLDTYEARNRVPIAAIRAAEKKCGIHPLDPVPYLCAGGECQGSKNGQPLYFDDDHLSESGNKKLLPLFSGALQ